MSAEVRIPGSHAIRSEGEDMSESLTLENGKYTVELSESGEFHTLRFGEPWRDLTGDKLVLALFQRVRQLEGQEHESKLSS